MRAPRMGFFEKETSLGGDRLPAELRLGRPGGPAYLAPWEFPGPLPPSAVPSHPGPEAVGDMQACPAGGARAVAGLPGPPRISFPMGIP